MKFATLLLMSISVSAFAAAPSASVTAAKSLEDMGAQRIGNLIVFEAKVGICEWGVEASVGGWLDQTGYRCNGVGELLTLTQCLATCQAK